MQTPPYLDRAEFLAPVGLITELDVDPEEMIPTVRVDAEDLRSTVVVPVAPLGAVTTRVSTLALVPTGAARLAALRPPRPLRPVPSASGSRDAAGLLLIALGVPALWAAVAFAWMLAAG